MQNMAERLADNAHDIWAKKKKEELVTNGSYNFVKLKQFRLQISNFMHKKYCFLNLTVFSQVEEYTHN